jgi:hypothetical protein
MAEPIPQHISISNDKQLVYWCDILGCKPDELKEAVEKMGSCTEEVKLYLTRKPNKKGVSFWTNLMK